MDNEFQILNNIDKNKKATQRDIAKNTGMSLGNVNILIKRLVKKGLLKIERLNPRTIRYILTPGGLKEKAEATYMYVVASYKFINEINSKINLLLNSTVCTEVKQVFLFGNHDEILDLLQNKFSQKKISYNYIHTLNELEEKLNNTAVQENLLNKNYLILAWHPDCAEELSDKGIAHINLLEGI